MSTAATFVGAYTKHKRSLNLVERSMADSANAAVSYYESAQFRKYQQTNLDTGTTRWGITSRRRETLSRSYELGQNE